MTHPIESLPPASFDGIGFPYTDLEAKGALDHHVHKYLHRPGGEVESLARKIYEFTFTILAHEVYRGFQNFYPLTLSKIISRCESGKTFKLVVPNMGTFEVKAVDWTRNLTQRVKSGESVKIRLLEDNTKLFAAENILAPAVASLPTKASILAEVIAQVETGITDEIKAKLAALQNEINILVGQRDAVLAKADYVIISAQGALSMCADLDLYSYFKDANNAVAIGAFHDVWNTIAEISNDTLEKTQSPSIFVTDAEMTVIELALRLYSDTNKTKELMQLNLFNDAMRIPSDFPVTYYPKAA